MIIKVIKLLHVRTNLPTKRKKRNKTKSSFYFSLLERGGEMKKRTLPRELISFVDLLARK